MIGPALIPIINSDCNLFSLASIIVTYNPNIKLLSNLIKDLPSESALILVDNASQADASLEVQALAKNRNRTQFIKNASNIGLAAALNQGAIEMISIWPDTLFVLLLDQDSEPTQGSIECLMTACKRLIAKHNNTGCVGPQLIDPDTGLIHGFHHIQNGRWTRKFIGSNHSEPVACHNINGSGTLMPVALFKALGGLDESLFIDHVDTDWSFRVLAAGGFLYGIPNAVFYHRMGESGKRIWLGRWQTYPLRSPLRHYYLFRNAVKLIHRDYVPFVWKFWAVFKLILTFVIHILFDKKRFLQATSMIKGVRDGICYNGFNLKGISYEKRQK